MPKIQLKGLDDTVFVLNRLTDKSEGVIKRAIYDGAGILADAVRANIDTIKTGGRRETQKAGLRAGLTTFKIEEAGGTIAGGVGFDGYNELGQANRMIARVFNSGTSFSSRQPFFERAIRSARYAARQKVLSELEDEIDKLTKG